jgi:amino acid adenylation domain-containing protein
VAEFRRRIAAAQRRVMPSPAAGKAGSDARRLLHAVFDGQADRTPDRVAIHCLGERVSYRRLRADSDRIAQGLRSRGIAEGAAVGLYMDRSIGYVAAMLGILKANAAVVPLPPAYPESRLRDILGFAQLDAVIVDELPLKAGHAVRILPLQGLLAAQGDAVVAASGEPGQTAFVLCSSGSTGQPKMIARSHGSFFHRLEWTWTQCPYAEDEACIQKSHMTTTHAIYELFEPLLAGVPVHVVPDETVRDLERFWDFIRTNGITRLLIVPSMLQVSLDLPGFAAPPLRVVVLMGEYVQSRLAGRAIGAFPPDTRIFSIYGSTESSSTLICDLRESWREGAELPLGRPISPDVVPHVLGPALEPVAPGESGLLHMSGPALFTDYFRNPSLTASAFVQAPGNGERLFNTQDQVRRMADGSIEFIGRVDHTVKVRGFRVDLGEVERAILEHPGIGQAAVMLGGPAVENPPLVAFYAPEVERAELLQVLKGRLAPYMVPSVLVGMPSFPLTASGKADRMRLLDDYRRRPLAPAAHAEFTPTEAQIAGIWRRVLGHADPEPDSNFFEVGGTSLSVFTVVNLLRDAFQLDRSQLSDHTIYEYPTLRQLADCVDRLRSGQLPARAGEASVAVTLKQGDPRLAPLFVIASSGGTLGAYDRLSKKLETGRAVVGVRDPFVWGAREPAMSFADWISIYLEAMRGRQPAGPYYVCAFSSAGAFGYEIAQRLRREGQEVAELILVDPVGIAGEVEGDFGFKAFRALFRGRRSKLAVRLAGWWRRVSGNGRKSGARPGGNEFAMTHAEFERRSAAIRRDKGVIKDLSSLFELNSGLPFTMTDADFAGRRPEEYLAAFLEKVKAVAPDVEPETVERILIQYYGLQLPATHFYELRNYDGKAVIYEPAGPQTGLLAAYFGPHVRELRVRTLPVGAPSERIRFVCQNLSRSLRTHYRSMRDETFVAALAAEMDALLR